MNISSHLSMAALALACATPSLAALTVTNAGGGGGTNLLSWNEDETVSDPWSGMLTGRFNNVPGLFANLDSNSAAALVFGSGGGQSTIVANPEVNFGDFSLFLSPLAAPATMTTFDGLVFAINASSAGWGRFSGGGDTQWAQFGKSGGLQWFTVTSTTPIDTFGFQTFSGSNCAANPGGCSASSYIESVRQVRLGDITSPVPEPQAYALAFAGLVVLSLIRRRQQQKKII